jgi:hypothetical protein
MDPTSWQLAKDVISEALRRPVSERERFVRSRCPDAALADELVAMLHVDATIGVGDDPDTEPYDPGTRIGPYIVLDRLGRGGMGEVFLGNDPRLQRKVALKCVIRSLTGAGEARQRILHEARAAARVNHPNVATIHDIIEIEDRAFIVMEYVEGESLAARLKRNPLSVAEVLAIGKQLASALAGAHAKGVVHRDLKPANVQLTPDGHAKVLDFGVANAPRLTVTNPSASASTRTPAQTTVRVGQPGTPPYMSPEQLLGRAVDERSDIFSLGVVLFEMATGRRPFAGDDHLSLIVEQARGAPRTDTVNPQVPRALADLIARAMAIKADERFASAADVVSALAAIERGLERRSEPLSRKIARGLSAVAVALAGVGAIGGVVIAGFNNTFGRTGEFARFGVEPWRDYFRWGVAALIPTLFIMALAAAALYAVRVVLRVVAAWAPAARLVRRTAGPLRATWTAIGFDSAATQAQALAGLGLASIAVALWYFRDLVLAITSFFNSSPVNQLLPMEPYSRHQFAVTIDVLMLLFAYGALGISRRLRAEKAPGAGAAIGVLASVLIVMVLISQWPYRTLNHRDFPRATFGGQRCYVTGRTATEYLLLCPNASPPRNRAVPQPQVENSIDGVENVFKGVER